jgi:hypothetical protein
MIIAEGLHFVGILWFSLVESRHSKAQPQNLDYGDDAEADA